MTDLDESGGNIFEVLDANEDGPPKQPQVYHMPVKLYKDESSGEDFFYLQKGSFPERQIVNLNILYTDKEKAQVKEQVQKDKTCPEIILKNVQVECDLSDSSTKSKASTNKENDDPSSYLKDESFRLSGSKIGAIRMRMYAKQKTQAQKQMTKDPECKRIMLELDIECRLVSKNDTKVDRDETEHEDNTTAMEQLPPDEDITEHSEGGDNLENAGQAQSIEELEVLLASNDLTSEQRKKLKKKLKKKRQHQRKMEEEGAGEMV